MQSKRLTVKDVAVLGVMTATVEAAKLALAFVPNVELVTFLFILYALFMGPKVLLSVYAFVGIECMVWGLGIWNIMYLYIWPLLVILVLFFRKQKSVWFFSTLSGVFGLLFGALCAIPYLFIGGVTTALTWWIAGIPYDILHGISNFILCAVLFVPMNKALQKIKNMVYP